jgi:predicted transcriptional regulator
MSQSRPHRRGRGGQGGHEPRTRLRTRELRALELSNLGWSQHRIAADLGISQAAVSKLLKRAETRQLRELADTLERQKARQTARLEHQYTEATHAWERSKGDATRKRQRKTQDGHGGADATVAEIVVENQHGDPRYLEAARKALADIRKLWGLEAPRQLKVLTRNPYDGLTEEALRQELTRQTALLGAAEGATPSTTHALPDAGHVNALSADLMAPDQETGDGNQNRIPHPPNSAAGRAPQD